MSEREKLQEAVERAGRLEQQQREADQRRDYEYSQRRSELAYALRETLKEMVKDYEPKMRLRFTETGNGTYSHRFELTIGGTSTALRRPFASFEIRVSGRDYSMSDLLPTGHHRYEIPVGPTERLEKVTDAIRDVAVAYLSKKDSTPYEWPEWYTVLITIGAFLVAAATWGVIALLGGVWGILLGWMPAWAVFKILQHIGPVGVLLGIAAYAYYLLVEGTK
jgi:hypothetical protein